MATTYRIILMVDKDDLRTMVLAGVNITVSKAIAGSGPSVAWQSVRPFEANQITWDEQYGLYASASGIFVGSTIAQISRFAPAVPERYYNFSADGTFSGPFQGKDAPALNAYRVFNKMPASNYPSLTFGLTQKATVNGQVTNEVVVNAESIVSGSSSTFVPNPTAHVWLQPPVAPGTVVSEPATQVAVVTFGPDVYSQTLVYNRDAGMFVLANKAFSSRHSAFSR